MPRHPARRCVTTGLDRLLEDPGHWLRGRRFGLVTNIAARAASGESGYRLIATQLGAQLRAVFAPEHGLEAIVPEADDVPAGHLPSGVPVFSLYGSTGFRPTRAMLDGLDALLVDMQDVGSRYYTYAATLVECLIAAADAGIPVMVLDRPNPLGGLVVEGPGVEDGYRSLVGPLDTPVRHGLTLAETARLAAKDLGLDRVEEAVEVVPMLGWERSMPWQETGLTWYPPSPGAKSIAMVRLYPGTCLVEGVNVSEGRGTDAPFELVGAPWVDGDVLARAINRWADVASDCGPLAGQMWPRAVPAVFTPTTSKYAGRICTGVRLEPPPEGRDGKGMVAFGVALLHYIAAAHHDQFDWVRPHAENAEQRYQADMSDPARPRVDEAEHRYHIDLLAGGTWLRRAVGQPRSLWSAGRPDDPAAAGKDDLVDLDALAELIEGWRGDEARYRERAAEAIVYGRSEWLSAARMRHGAALAWHPGLDLMSGRELARAIAESAADAAAVVLAEQPALGRAIDLAAAHLAGGGRLIYAGAGTSGRLGALDASECEPTFGVPRGRVLALVAGGPAALTCSTEGAEDDEEAGRRDIAAVGAGPADVLVGIAASGTTPYTVAALKEARLRGAFTIAVVCALGTPLAAADIAVEVDTGSEPLSGSTRLKAGTAQKVILNAISTGVFARLGYVYDDLMVGVQPVNAKLQARAVGIVAAVTGAAGDAARAALDEALHRNPRLAVRLAILRLIAGCSTSQAEEILAASGESLRRAIAAAAALRSAPGKG